MGNTFKPPCDEGLLLAPNAAASAAPLDGPWILAATILGSSMAFIDSTVVNVALPALQADFSATVLDAQWVVESYALPLAALLLVGGSLGDRYGRRLIYALGIAVFALASAWCTLAPSVGQLILARAIQGAGAALLVPGSLAIISASFGDEARGRAIGTWSAFTSITAAVGPVIGGWLVENISWRAAFCINVPIAVVVLTLLFWRVPESRGAAQHSRLDWPGAALVTLGLGAAVYGLIESSRFHFAHPIVIGSLGGGVALLAAFVLVEARAPDPMLPLGLFRSPHFRGANVLTLLLYAALSGALFFLPLDLIQVQGYSATAAGAALLPFILLMFFLSRWSGGLVARYGPRRPLIIGPAIASAGFVLLAVPDVGRTYWVTFFPAVVVLGLGMAVSVAPLTTTVMSAVEQNRAGVASGVNNAVSRTAGLLAVAVFGIVMLQMFDLRLDEHLRTADLTQAERTVLGQERLRLADMPVPATLDRETRTEIEAAIDDAFVFGFRCLMLVAAGLAAAGAATAWWMIPDRSPR